MGSRTGSLSLMDEAVENRFKMHVDRLLEPASTLFAVQRSAGDRVQGQTMEGYGRLRDAHLLLTGVLGAALVRADGVKAELRKGDMELTALLASFVIGMDLCERAVAEGRLLQAAALVRQEMETVTQMVAVSSGKYCDGKTPNVRVLEESLRRMYSSLSEAAHVSRHSIVRSATLFHGDAEATSYTRHFPDFDGDVSRRLFTVHLLLIAKIFELCAATASEPVSDEDRDAVRIAFALMEEEGMVALEADGA